MQQAHGGLFVIGGAGFDDRADQHLQQPAADGVDHHGNDQPGKRAGQQLRQHGQRDEPGGRKDVRQHHRRAVADAVDEARAEQVDRKLHAEVEGDEQRDARKRDAVALLEGQKQQRRKVVDDGLHDVADKAGFDCVFIAQAVFEKFSHCFPLVFCQRINIASPKEKKR